MIGCHAVRRRLRCCCETCTNSRTASIVKAARIGNNYPGRREAMLSKRLQGKVAIGTGTGSGIGQGCALMFARHGARVMGCDINADAAQATFDQARREDLALDSVHPCDLTSPVDVERLMLCTAERYGGLDVLVNAAAFGAFGFIEQLDYERDWKRTLSGELDLVFLGCKAA